MKSRDTQQKETLQKQVNAQNGFFDADTIYTKVQDKIGLATVYRFLKTQVKHNKLHAYQCDKRTIYSKNKTHCHFEDEETGEIIHFDINSIDFLKKHVPGDISSISIEVKGKLSKK